MVASAEVHLRLLNERAIPLIVLKQLLPLLAAAYVDAPIDLGLEYRTEVAKRMLHVLQVYCALGKVLQVMENQLLLVRHEDCNAVFLRE